MLKFRGFWLYVCLFVSLGATYYLYFYPELFPNELGVSSYVGPGDTGKIEEHARYYDIVATYATSTPLKEAVNPHASEVAVGLMKGFLETTITQFKQGGNFDNLTEKDIQMMGYEDGRKQSLQINYISSESPRTVSYIFTIYTDTFGAHGNTDYKTFVFDTSDGSSVTLANLFNRGAPYLERLSTLSRAAISAQLETAPDDPMLTRGTTPTESSFKNFFLDDQSLVIIFPPYAVAAYAAGAQTVAIPRSELQDFLKPAYQ